MTSDALVSEAPIAAVRLTVSDVAHTKAFYEAALGLRELQRDGDVLGLGPEGGEPIVELVGDPGAPARPAHTTGLFRFALVVPSRNDLGLARHRAVEAGWSITVGQDVHVAEALYVDDPEGNGVEIYWDRPADQWRDEQGRLEMFASDLDFGGLLARLPSDGHAGSVSPATRLGHVHLHVSDLPAAEAFYRDVLGFEVTLADIPGALFLATANYHHHVALHYPEQTSARSWGGVGAPSPPAGARGLRHVEVRLRDAAALDEAERRLAAGGHPVSRDNGFVRTADPSANGLLLRVSA